MENKIQAQTAKVEELRKKYRECTSKAYRDFIAVTGKIEKDKLERMREKEQKSAEPQLF